MSGEGSGGGGALALLLAMWVVAMAFVLGDRLTPDEPLTAGEPAGAAAPLVRGCASAKECEISVTRAELAVTLARAFDLPVTTMDFFGDDDGRLEQADINRVAAAGLTSGCREGEFCPDRLVSRGQLATFLDRALALPEAEADAFTDDDGIVHEPAINRLAASGLVSGCGPEAFCPDEPITRGELHSILQRVLAVDDPVA